MAVTVPRYQRQVGTPNTTTAVFANPRPLQIGAAVTEDAGNAAQNIGQQMAAAQVRISRREDAARRALEASSLSTELADDYRARLTGNQLMTSEQVQEYRGYLDGRVAQAVENHKGSLDSKAALQERLLNDRNRLLDEASFAALEATRAAGRQDQENRFRPIANSVVNDPSRLADAYQQADAIAADYADLYTPEEDLEIAARQRAQIAAAAVEGYMARGLYNEAADLVQMPGVVEAMTPEQQSNFQQRLMQARERENAQWNAYQSNLQVFASVLGTTPDALPTWARVQAAGLQMPEPRGAQTDVGKAIQDRAMFVNQFGEDSPQVRYFDEALNAGERDLTTEAGIRKEFTNQSKDFVSVRDSYGRIEAATSNASPAGDLALIFNYMKMLDPGSTVRESEFAAAAAAGSFGQQLQAAAEQYISGERLTPVMRADFVRQARNLLQTQLQAQIGLEDEYTRLARDANITPQSVIVDYVGDMRNLARIDAARSGSDAADTTQEASEPTVIEYGLDGEPLGSSSQTVTAPQRTGAAAAAEMPRRASGGADGQIDPGIIDEIAAFAEATPDAGRYFEQMADILDAADEAGREMTLEEAFEQAKAAAGG